MKQIYIILTHTGTLLSKIIKNYTKDEFSHASISLDIELNKMYSFGRLNPSNPFIGGFVHEYIHKGTFKKFKNTVAKIYSLNITDEQYKKIEEKIKQIGKEKENYKFNIKGLFAAGFHKKIAREQYFYCAEFVKYLIEYAEIDVNLPPAVKPEHFKNINEQNIIYEGLLRKYKSPKVKISDLLKKNLAIYKRKEGII